MWNLLSIECATLTCTLIVLSKQMRSFVCMEQGQCRHSNGHISAFPSTMHFSCFNLQHGKFWCDTTLYDTNSTAAPEAHHKLVTTHIEENKYIVAQYKHKILIIIKCFYNEITIIRSYIVYLPIACHMYILTWVVNMGCDKRP